MSAPPILSLPIEITQKIFREALPSTGPPSADPPQPLSQQAPLLLTQICRDWRDIALDTPELWQSITVDSSSGPVSPLMVGLWMFRASNRPRDISFTTRDTERGTDFLEESMVYSHQWRDVELRLPMESFSDLVAYHGPFPILRSLSLSIGSQMFSEVQTITVRDAPLLHEVTLTDFPFLAADIAWEQLTILKITTHVAAPAIFALQRCSNLVDLEFSLLVPGRDAESLAIPPFVLPSLKTLLTAGKSLLPFITAPSLEQLDIWGPGFSGDMDSLTESLDALLERSTCPLKLLSFRMPPNITAAGFHAFLQAAGPVVELKLTLYFPSGLEELVAVLQSADVLPRLTALRIMDASSTTAFGPLLDTLRARRELVAGRANLELFSLILHHGASDPIRTPPDAAMSEFNVLADDGLHVRIFNGNVLVDR